MVDSKRRRIKEFGVPRSLFTVHRSPGARVWGSIGVGAHRYPDAKFQIDSDLRGLRAIIGQNLVFLRGFSENSFASLINRARARMAWLGLLRSPGRGIVEDRSA